MSTVERQPTIRLINFNTFVAHGSIPRFPPYENLTCLLKDINRNDALIVFVSHSWLRGHQDTEGWDGTPHPDTVNNDKFHIIVRGITFIMKAYASSMSKCYLWIDYTCIDQVTKPKLELLILDEIVKCCDIIFTPINDDIYEHTGGLLHMTSNIFESMFVTGYMDEYNRTICSELWNGRPNSYLNRGWCRLEMLYASNVPLLNNSDSSDRSLKFAGALAYQYSKQRRLHVVMGNSPNRDSPHFLPPFQSQYWKKYDPLKGNFSKESDRAEIADIICKVVPAFRSNDFQIGYDGEKIWLFGFMAHGFGTHCYENGSKYIGEWQWGRRHGNGKFWDNFGNSYDGEWQNGHKCGQGFAVFDSSSSLSGTFLNDYAQGYGEEIFHNGSVYKGYYDRGLRHGRGTKLNINGDGYDGYWSHGSATGKGVLRKGGVVVYSGDFLKGYRHGMGIEKLSDNSTYSGNFKEGKRCGYGELTTLDGRKVCGQFDGWKVDGQDIRGISAGTVLCLCSVLLNVFDCCMYVRAGATARYT